MTTFSYRCHGDERSGVGVSASDQPPHSTMTTRRAVVALDNATYDQPALFNNRRTPHTSRRSTASLKRMRSLEPCARQREGCHCQLGRRRAAKLSSSSSRNDDARSRATSAQQRSYLGPLTARAYECVSAEQLLHGCRAIASSVATDGL